MQAIVDARDYEAAAESAVPVPAWTYVSGGAGRGEAVAANRAAFSRWAVVPRLAKDMRAGHTRLTLLGQGFEHPILLAPVAFQSLLRARGEIETARAAQATDTGLVASTLATCTLEDIAAAAGPRRWFQLYLQPQRAASETLVRRAEESGYGALVVTLDAPVQPLGHASARSGFHMPAGCAAVNLEGAGPAEPVVVPEGASRVFQGAMAGAPRWEDVAWLASLTRLPILVKGVMHPQDARHALAHGAAGVVVSNHGGRVLAQAPATLDVLPGIREALGPKATVLVDGGIRSGADAFIGLALGADAVMVGRLQAAALAAAGALGVGHMVRLLREELELCMALAGCATLEDITGDTLRRC